MSSLASALLRLARRLALAAPLEALAAAPVLMTPTISAAYPSAYMARDSVTVSVVSTYALSEQESFSWWVNRVLKGHVREPTLSSAEKICCIKKPLRVCTMDLTVR